jgi:hypothetical protein
MIISNEVIPLFLGACPSFQIPWTEYFQQNRENSGDCNLYSDIAVLAQYIINLALSDKTEELQHTFDVIERVLENGDEYVQEAITLGLLEEIQNLAQENGLLLNQFETYLKSESKRRWDLLITFWTRVN